MDTFETAPKQHEIPSQSLEDLLSPGAERTRTIICEALPRIAAELVTQYQDMSDPANQSFAAHPNDPAEHHPLWHEHGIETHSLAFQRHLQHEAPVLLEKWGVLEPARAVLSQEIDDITKWELLQDVALVHDVGKYTARAKKVNKQGEAGRHFGDHEAHSGHQIREGVVHDMLRNAGRTEEQIAYIARGAELHYKMAKVRDVARSQGGYTIAFTQSPEFKATAEKVMQENPDFALEIGLLYLSDSASKVTVWATAETDIDIANQASALEATLAAQHNNTALLTAALQVPVNNKAVEAYLRYWAAFQQPLAISDST